MTEYSYIREPGAIYDASFRTIGEEADLSGLDRQVGRIATRMIHACGMVDLAADIAASPGAGVIGFTAAMAGAPVFADAKMVAHGLIMREFQSKNPVHVMLDRVSEAPDGDTRSAAAVEACAEEFDGAIVAIGNAPTALFRLLELVRDGAPKPALVIGCPVGFVGAVESKDALIENPYGISFIAVRGRRGGSAMAAAALNAIAIGGRAK